MTERKKPATRLYVPDDLAAGATIALSEAQGHQLRNVLRLATGDPITVFNGRDGEYLARVEIEKRRAAAQAMTRLRAQDRPADIWLVFAPIKHERLGFLVEKASELGVARLLPVITGRTQNARVNIERLRETAREAAEQCERLTVPEVEPPRPLPAFLEDWNRARRLFLCAEAGEVQPALQAFVGWNGPAALLIGPEGGFAPGEFSTLRALDFVVPVSLGATILRAETAALSALACWQASRQFANQ